MKVVFLTANTSRMAGGLYFTITEYTKSLKRKGVDVSVVGFEDEYANEDIKAYGNVNVIPYKKTKLPVFNTFGYSSDLLDILDHIKPQIIHIQGIWMYHSWAAFKYRKKHPEVKLIIEPHGMLDSWALKNSAWKKKIVGFLFEYKNLNNADCLHALCESEFNSFRTFGLHNRIEVIPNGINLPNINKKKHNFRKKIVQYIGRIHPKKGLDILIHAIKEIVDSNPELLNNFELRIAGWNQNGYQEQLESMVSEWDLSRYVEFTGPRFGEEKMLDLMNATAFILPSLSEGLPMSILEAWSYRLPVLMTEFCNLPEGFKNDAAIKIGTSSQSVKNGLINLMKMSNDDLQMMGERGRQLVERDFSWDTVANKTIALYNSLLNEC